MSSTQQSVHEAVKEFYVNFIFERDGNEIQFCNFTEINGCKNYKFKTSLTEDTVNVYFYEETHTVEFVCINSYKKEFLSVYFNLNYSCNEFEIYRPETVRDKNEYLKDDICSKLLSTFSFIVLY